MPKTLSKALFPLGKSFAECRTRRRSHGESSDGEEWFAECLHTGTRRSFYRVPSWHSANMVTTRQALTALGQFVECPWMAHGEIAGFAECNVLALGKDMDTLPSASSLHSAKLRTLCRVPEFCTRQSHNSVFLKIYFSYSPGPEIHNSSTYSLFNTIFINIIHKPQIIHKYSQIIHKITFHLQIIIIQLYFIQLHPQ